MDRSIFIDMSGLGYYWHCKSNYCHFLLGNLFQCYLALKRDGRLGEPFELVAGQPIERFARFYRVLGATGVRVGDRTLADTVVTPLSDEGLSPEKIRLHSQDFADFVSYLHERLGVESAAPDQVTYVTRRPNTNRRFIVNERALIKAIGRFCDARGVRFEAVDFDGMELEDQIFTMARTRLLTGAHGAGMVNCMFCREGAMVAQIWPHPDFNHGNFDLIAASLGVGHHHVHATRITVPNLLSIRQRHYRTKKNRWRRDRVMLVDTTMVVGHLEQLLDWKQTAPAVNKAAIGEVSPAG